METIVVAARDGEASWRVLQGQGADLVVIDNEMPGLDGFALTEWARRPTRFAASRSSSSPHAMAPGDRRPEAGAAPTSPRAFEQAEVLATIERII